MLPLYKNNWAEYNYDIYGKIKVSLVIFKNYCLKKLVFLGFIFSFIFFIFIYLFFFFNFSKEILNNKPIDKWLSKKSKANKAINGTLDITKHFETFPFH